MKVHKIISKSKSGRRMEVIAINGKGRQHTLHIHRHLKGWQYCADRIVEIVGKLKVIKLIFKMIDMGGKNELYNSKL